MKGLGTVGGDNKWDGKHYETSSVDEKECMPLPAKGTNGGATDLRAGASEFRPRPRGCVLAAWLRRRGHGCGDITDKHGHTLPLQGGRGWEGFK